MNWRQEAVGRVHNMAAMVRQAIDRGRLPLDGAQLVLDSLAELANKIETAWPESTANPNPTD